ncbi:cytochrome P450 [Rostrohypoxylon terebratum]|nr:cytochrome P450 [Rostrohypoxylon terebratum]
MFFQTHNWQTPVGSLGLGVLSGFCVHYGIFIHGEWHAQAPHILLGHVWIFLCIPLAKHFFDDLDVIVPLESIFWVICGYVLGLMTSIAIYRNFFHRLTKAGFPGPSLARVTKLWHVWACRNARNHQVLYNLNKKYGDFVRTGPSEVSVFHPDVFMATDGPRSDCIKSEWYDLLLPDLALNTARDKTLHAGRRRQWNGGFTSKPLSFHEERVLKHIEVLDQCIQAEAKTNKVSHMKDLLYWFAFDAMGDFVMSKSFGMLQNQNWHHIVTRLGNASSLLGPLSPAPWLVQIGLKLAPSLSVVGDWRATAAWCRREVRERLTDKSRYLEKDLVHYVMMEGAADEIVSKNALTWLNGDALQAIVAGSAPIANTLLGLLTELGRAPVHAQKIYEELEGINDVSDVKELTKLPHLNACITETLRIYPALVTGGQRKTGNNSIIVAGTIIPPHTTITAPQWVIARREDCFVRAKEFVPERWTTAPELVLNRAATAPFGTGKYSCLGRHLALDTIRLTAARLIQKYTFEYAPGEEGTGMTEKLRDHFITSPGDLNLRFELRKRGKDECP